MASETDATVHEIDDYAQWPQACHALQQLEGLRSLYMEISVYHMGDEWKTVAVDDHWLIAILGPLCAVRAPLFEIEMNLAVPDDVYTRLKNPTFVIIVKRRPYDAEVFYFC